MNDLFNLILAVLVLGLGLCTVLLREAFAAVVSFIAYGLLLTLVWLQLHGIDVALTEAAIGGGLTGALLIGAAARLRSTEAALEADRPSVATRCLAAAVATSVSVALVLCWLALPDPAPTLAPEVVANIASTGVGNPITAVLLSFRAMDTLLEAIVLLLALAGVWSFTPDAFWGGRPGALQRADPNGILAYAARVLAPVGVVVAMYIFWVGADYPGGKFQGATLLASLWLLVMMAGLADAPPISRTWLRLALVAGPAVFVAVGLVGVVAAGAFLAYPVQLAKPLIIVIELALLPSLAVALGLLLAGAPQRGAVP